MSNKMKSKCGWLLPNGDYYGCEYTGHWGLADDLLYAGKEEDDNMVDAEIEAENLGWIKISGCFSSQFVAFKKPTQKQLDKIFDYCEVHKLDYEAQIKKFKHFESVVPAVFH